MMRRGVRGKKQGLRKKVVAARGKERRSRDQSSAKVARPSAKAKAKTKAGQDVGLLTRQRNRTISEWLDSKGSGRALMAIAHDAVILRDPTSRIESWNASAERLYGWTAKEARGKVTHTLLETKFPKGLKEANDALFKVGYWEGELEHRRKDGTRIVVESRQALLRDPSGAPMLIKEINRDITQQLRRLKYLRVLGEVSSAMNEASSVEDALRKALTSICIQTDWDAARGCMVNRETNQEIPGTSVWYLSDEKRFAPLRDATDTKRRRPNEKCVAERVLENGGPVWVPDVRKDSYFAARPEIQRTGVKCSYGFPVILSPGVAIAIALFADSPMEVDEAFAGTMNGIGRHLARLSQRLSAENTHRDLSISLMRAQDDERRRVARELHDSTGQYLSALTLAIDAARSHQDLPAASIRKLEEAAQIINHCSAEVRTLSHLLHPPLLEELGLVSAVNWYLDGFAERSGLQMQVDIPAQMARFEPAAELALFRALQECLTNIHRHSGSKTAAVKIEVNEQNLTLEVRDQGKGIEQTTLGGWLGNSKRMGVGISGMRERVKDLGGTLDIQSGQAGTTVIVAIPARVRTAVVATADEVAVV